MSQVKIQTEKSTANDWIRQTFSGAPLRIAIILIALLWTIPSVGLLITSFRAPDDIQTSGWWTVFRHPFELSQYTIQNYAQVITADGMGVAFLNSLLVTIPAVDKKTRVRSLRIFLFMSTE